MMMMILFFDPIFKETMWGGNKLEKVFQYPTGDSTGECWGISAHPNGVTPVKAGLYDGKNLVELWNNHRELFGNYPADEFPILVKIIDAFDDLSIQVHPNDQQAKMEGSLGKNECWYILDADPLTEIIIGHHAKTKGQFMSYVEKGDYHHLIQTFPVHKGDFFYIEAGTLHAICKGTLLLEVQQSSDITYRFYDYDRIYHGKKRELHLRKAINTVKIPDEQVKRTLEKTTFGLEIKKFNEITKLENSIYGTFFVCLEGLGTIGNQNLKKGDFGFVSCEEPSFEVSGKTQIALITLRTV